MAVYWGGLPFPPPVDHILSELSTVTHPSWWPYTAWFIASLQAPVPEQVLWLTLNEALMPESCGNCTESHEKTQRSRHAGINTKLGGKKKKSSGNYFQKESVYQTIGNEQVSSINLAVLCRQS